VLRPAFLAYTLHWLGCPGKAIQCPCR
jgi:hypothetical protein